MAAGGGAPQGPPMMTPPDNDGGGDLAGALAEVNAILEGAIQSGGAGIDMQSAGPELEKMMQLMDELSQGGQPPSAPQGAPPMGPPEGM